MIKKLLSAFYLVFLLFITLKSFSALMTFNSIIYYASFLSILFLCFCWFFWSKFNDFAIFHYAWIFLFVSFYLSASVGQMYYYFGSQFKFYFITAVINLIGAGPFFLRLYLIKRDKRA